MCISSWAQVKLEPQPFSNEIREALPPYVRLQRPAPAVRLETKRVPETDTCGHIVVVPVPKDYDRKFVVPTPEFSSRMPVKKGVPPCSPGGR